MESNFTNDEFEDFLKRSADGMRMRPSDQVWEGIAANLKKRRRRVAFATSAFLLLSSVLGYFIIDHSKELANTSLATLPSEVQKSNNSQSTPSHSLSSVTETEAKVIDINQSPTTSLAKNQAVKNRLIRQYPSKKLSNTLQSSDQTALVISGNFTPTVVDSDPDPSSKVEPTVNVAVEDLQSEKLLSIESVTNLYKPSRKKTKLGLQIFFTPTVSYRKLSENKSYLRSIPQPNLLSGNRRSSYFNVNDAVTHKPDLGLELGLATKYPITQKINLRGGLQFNINRYDIKAFRSSPEVATIALNRDGNGVDYVGSISDYRNFNGYRSDWLENFYFQVSAPIGAEVILIGNKKTHFGIAGTIQPTYLIGERTYVLSSDYKNYSEVPWLTRRWNVNTAVETFVSYSTGKIQWQVGPQMRYQLLSSFIEKYP
ncbi:MAG TPA: hypothetical protein VD794_09980, partial [Flavisolibacter sp.]|nr:hypothetical protein [Flavisolibacter sp.]